MPFPSAWRPEVIWNDVTGHLTKFAFDWLFAVHRQVNVPQSFEVDSLPTNLQPGALAFASNGRKVGEGLGAGTGTIAYFDGAQWRRVGDDTTVAA